MSNTALSGIKVLDLSQFEAGPVCTETLAWLGAEVLKLERPTHGEGARTSVGDPLGLDSWSFMLLNANKKSITADLKKPEGLELVKRLIEKCDIFVENFAPGVIEKLGLSYNEVAAINPKIIYATIKGFASDSPWAAFPAFDPVGQATGGSSAMTGVADGPPVRPGASVADSGAGFHTAIGILAALYQRQRTGRGQRIEVAMQDAVMNFTRTSWQTYNATGKAATRERADFVSAPKGMYPCAPFGHNDYVQIFTSRWPGSSHWERLLTAMGREDLIGNERYATPHGRFERKAEVDELVATWTAQHTKTEAMELLAAAGVPAGAVMDAADLAADESMRKRGMVVSLRHPVRGDVTIPGFPVRMSDSAVEVTRAPLLGEHNTEVYGELLGLDDVAVKELVDRHVL